MVERAELQASQGTFERKKDFEPLFSFGNQGEGDWGRFLFRGQVDYRQSQLGVETSKAKKGKPTGGRRGEKRP